MLLRLSRTAQASANGRYRACLAPASCRSIALRRWFADSSAFRDCNRDNLEDDTDDIENISNGPTYGVTTTRTSAGILTTGGPRRAWLGRRFNRITPSLPCKDQGSRDPEEEWFMEENQDGVARAIEAICVPQSRLKDHERAFELREAHLDSMHAIYNSDRLVSRAGNISRVAQSQQDEETAHVAFVREGGAQQSSVPDDPPEETRNLAYDPRGMPIFEVDIRQLESDNRLEEELRLGPYRGTTKDIHRIRKRERMVAMVDDLMKQAAIERYRGEIEPIRLAMESLDGPWTALDMLKGEGYPRYESDDADPVAAVEGIMKANNHFRLLFARWERSKWEEEAAAKGKTLNTSQAALSLTTTMVYKMCFNILAQPYAPDVHTYNTIILGLMTVGEHRLARIVADNFLKDKVRPTKSSVVILLHHYYSSNDILSFYHWVRCMVGLDTRGVRLRNVNFAILEDQGGTFTGWVMRENVAVHKGWLVLRSWLDAGEMEALLRGLIFFGQAQHAAQILSVSLKCGYPIQTSTLIDLLSLVASRLDHDAASLLVRGLCANADDLISLLLDDDDSVCPHVLAPQLRRVLDIYAVRLSVDMGTLKHSWWKSPTESEDMQSQQKFRFLHLKASRLLTTEYPGRASKASQQLLPGLADIAIALWIKETSLYLKKVDSALKKAQSQLAYITDWVNKAWEGKNRKSKASLAPKIRAWLVQSFAPEAEVPVMRMPLEVYIHSSQKRRQRRRAMTELHILSEQVEILTGAIADSMTAFGESSAIRPEIRDAFFVKIPSISVDACVKMVYRHYGRNWVAAAKGQRSANAASYEVISRRRRRFGQCRWSPLERKRLRVEARVAIQASLHLSYLVKSEMGRLISPNACDSLLSTYGTWRRVPIGHLADLVACSFNDLADFEKLFSVAASARDTRLVQPVTQSWSPKTNPFHYLSKA